MDVKDVLYSIVITYYTIYSMGLSKLLITVCIESLDGYGH